MIVFWPASLNIEVKSQALGAVPSFARVSYGPLAFGSVARRRGARAGLSESIVTDSILVINPNSTEAVTRGIDEACEPLRIPGGPAIECVTLAEGPPGVETQQHVDSVVGPLVRMVSERERGPRGVRDRLLQRSGHPFGARGNEEAGARHRGVRDPYRA